MSKNKRVNINLNEANLDYARAQKINLSQLLNDALFNMRFPMEEAHITPPHASFNPFDPFDPEAKRWGDDSPAFETICPDPNVVQLCETPVNNHGCCGFGVSIRITSDRTGTVIAGYGCSSCWQVGHDDDSSPIEVGTTVKLPESCASWDEASKLVGYSHNELIDDRDEPQPDTTRVTPYQLIK